MKDLEEQKISKVEERKKENKAIQKMFDDAKEKYGNTIDSDKKVIENNQSRQELLRSNLEDFI